MSDTLNIFGRTYPNATGIKAYDTNGNLLTFTKAAQGVIVDATDTAGGTIRTINTVDEVHLQANKNITPSSTSQVVTPDTGYDGFAQVTIGASDGLNLYNDLASNKSLSGVITITGTKLKSFICNQQANITEVYAPNATTIDSVYYNGGNLFSSCFLKCSKLTKAYLPVLTVLGEGMFRDCGLLEDLYIPNVTTISYANIFLNCSKLSSLVFPNLINQTLTTGVFRSCTSLEALDITAPSITFGGQRMFEGDTLLDTIVLRVPNLISMSYNNNFGSTPFASGGTGGTIYIPKSLYDHLGDGTSLDYKAATNWSTLDGYGTITWAKIEGSPYENYYVDGQEVPTE